VPAKRVQVLNLGRLDAREWGSFMSRKRHTPEQIINKLRQADVEIANGAALAQVLAERWRRHRKHAETAQLTGLSTTGSGGDAALGCRVGTGGLAPVPTREATTAAHNRCYGHTKLF